MKVVWRGQGRLTPTVGGKSPPTYLTRWSTLPSLGRTRRHNLTLWPCVVGLDTIMPLSGSPQLISTCVLFTWTYTYRPTVTLACKLHGSYSQYRRFSCNYLIIQAQQISWNDQSVNPTFKNVADCSSNPPQDRRHWKCPSNISQLVEETVIVPAGGVTNFLWMTSLKLLAGSM